MPCLTGTYLGYTGAVIPVLISNVAQQKGVLQYEALIDTGAEMSCVSTRVVQDLELLSRGYREMRTALEVRDVRTFVIGLEFKFGNRTVPMGRVFALEFLPSEFMHYEVVLGRDVLQRGALHFAPDGRFTFSL